jgi:predicted phosphodiesterase
MPSVVVAASDLHGHLPDVPACDLLLLAGDLCPVTDHSSATQAQFLAGPFKDWLESVPAKHVVGIAGNHDFIFERDPDLIPRGLRWTYLQDAGAVVGGFKIYGTPWQPWFYDWAFNLRTEDEMAAKWAKIPNGTDILVCHGPPHGYGDQTIRGDHTGSTTLLERIRAVRPRLVVFGHIHEGRGRWTLPAERPGERDVVLANVSLVDVRYRLAHEPMTFEL